MGGCGDAHLPSQATQEAEIGRTVLPSQPRQTEVCWDPITTEKNWGWSSQNGEKFKIGGEQSSLAWPKSQSLSPKYPEQKWLEAWLKC
jgi:hypothetical protein